MANMMTVGLFQTNDMNGFPKTNRRKLVRRLRTEFVIMNREAFHIISDAMAFQNPTVVFARLHNLANSISGAKRKQKHFLVIVRCFVSSV